MVLISASGVIIGALGLTGLAVAHGNEEHGPAIGGSMQMPGSEEVKPDFESYPPTYFALPDHARLMYAHIAVMSVAWIGMLPIGRQSWIFDSQFLQ
jgi:hypothetical protein